MEGEIVKSATCGATSTKLEEDWNDLPFAGLQAAARRFFLGRAKHGRFNWQKGDADFAEVRLSHAIRHVHLFAESRKLEDLDATLCNLMMIAWYVQKGIMEIEE